MRGVLAAEPLAAPDYAEIVDADSFEPVTFLRGGCLALLAARFGATRLIDNMLIETSPEAPVPTDRPSYRCSL
jgi:pantoate--beta-alanine ligase